MKKQIIFGILFSFVLLAVVFGTAVASKNYNQCNANNLQNCPEPPQVCDNGQVTGNPHCLPSVTPSAEPTEMPVEPTLTMTPDRASSTSAENPESPHGDGLSDGRESGHQDTPAQPKLLQQVGWK